MFYVSVNSNGLIFLVLLHYTKRVIVVIQHSLQPHYTFDITNSSHKELFTRSPEIRNIESWLFDWVDCYTHQLIKKKPLTDPLQTHRQQIYRQILGNCNISSSPIRVSCGICKTISRQLMGVLVTMPGNVSLPLQRDIIRRCQNVVDYLCHWIRQSLGWGDSGYLEKNNWNQRWLM